MVQCCNAATAKGNFQGTPTNLMLQKIQVFRWRLSNQSMKPGRPEPGEWRQRFGAARVSKLAMKWGSQLELRIDFANHMRACLNLKTQKSFGDGEYSISNQWILWNFLSLRVPGTHADVPIGQSIGEQGIDAEKEKYFGQQVRKAFYWLCPFGS